MFIATADAAVTGADFDATATVGIHGKVPQGSKEIQNELAWDIDSGGSVIVVRGLDEVGVKYWAFNAECPVSCLAILAAVRQPLSPIVRSYGIGWPLRPRLK
jgi:hypothetical protein